MNNNKLNKAFSLVLDLGWRRLALGLYRLVTPLATKIGLNKIRVGKRTIGQRINSFFYKVMEFNLPEPIEVHGMIMYQGTSKERGSFGVGYVFDYELGTQRVFKRVVKPGMTIIDVGANIGYYTLLGAKMVGEGGRVYAFEPDPLYFSLLKKNIEANRLHKIVEPFKTAVGNTEKTAVLSLGNLTGSSLVSLPGIRTNKTVEVEVVSLDSFFSEKNWPSADLVKIDIEGYERFALEGMRGLIKRNRGLNIIIELNPLLLEVSGTTAEELLCLLVELDFRRVGVLWKEVKFREIPRDIKYIADYSRNLGYVNLLCQRDE